MATCIVFDGNSIINRAFYGVRPLSNQAGLPTNAIFGFINIIQKGIASLGERPEYAAIAFDLKAPTFRHRAADFYKATRHPMPDDLARQMPYAKQVAAALGLKVVEKEGYEADDILGTISRICTEHQVTCVLVTGDRDSYQLINEYVTVHLAATNETKIMGIPEIQALYGVSPKQLIDVKAIMGDTSDNIPGVPGIGEKGATKLIAEYGSLQGVYDHIQEIKGSTQVKLEAGKESAGISRFLAEICLQTPISEELNDYRYQKEETAELRKIYTELEFRKMLDQLEEETPETKTAEKAEYRDGTAEELEGETISLAKKDDSFFAFDGQRAIRLKDIQEVAKLIRGEKRLLVWSKKDLLHDFWDRGIEDAWDAEDLSLMAYLALPTENGITFKNVVFKCLSITVDDHLRPELFPSVFKALKEKETPELKKLYQEIEKPLSVVLAEMERVGFRLDCDGLAVFSEGLGNEIQEYEQAIYGMAGHTFNLNSPKQLGTVLFEERNLPHSKKTKSGYSTDAETLEHLAKYDPMVERILDYRKAMKLKSTYGDGLLKVVSEDGRVHTTFRQTLTQTGRLSSVEPNLQNIPVRTEKGRELRRFFIAENGWKLIDADYSQVELRLLAHISGDEALIHAFQSGADIHTATASQVFDVPKERVTSEMRKFAKTINFGIIYGMGEYSLSQDLGISVAKAKEYIRSYFAQYPKIQEYMNHMKEFASEHYYVETLYGRRREIPELAQSNKVQRAFGERVAMNTPIQGTAADIIKIAMIRVSDSLKKAGLKARLVLQIHDELIVEAPDDEVEQAKSILEKEMEGVASLSVPLIAEAGVGDNWLEAKD